MDCNGNVNGNAFLIPAEFVPEGILELYLYLTEMNV
jgi:hypothetical protein